ncbi:hypothetical protein SLI_3571 [Streptomyces lividans 1326]|uniref:Uncharacterized protein n=1 Tax=Streptomyces lividans 1326 TaxID=1200984 RepID=A0A7U9DQI0_STRLI|nr:hypothetical protein SLI_3571 [Streptomyces lividans 1326]
MGVDAGKTMPAGPARTTVGASTFSSISIGFRPARPRSVPVESKAQETSFVPGDGG